MNTYEVSEKICRCCPVCELQLPVYQSSQTEDLFHASSSCRVPARATVNLALVAEVNTRRGHNDLGECLPYPGSASCTEAAFWAGHM